jgi:hypothetical protein
MLQRIPLSPSGSDSLNQLDQLVQRAQRKLGNVAGAQPAQAPQAAAAEEMDFANPEVLGQFLGQVSNAAADTSPFSHHALDPARVARLLAED